MSVLDTPRVYFRGQMTWDPMVTNNYDQLYDLAAGKPKLDGGTVVEYRERARQTIVQGNWNVHGTHRAAFVETTVQGVDRGHGPDRDDALVGAPVSFTGMLVDVEPYGATSSQLFFDQLACGVDGGSQVLAPSAGPVVARRINFARNLSYRVIAGVASVVWQTSFPTARGLSIRPAGSAVLEAFAGSLHDGGARGVTVRFNAYRTTYYGAEEPSDADAEDLAARIAGGGFHPNPARSTIVGVIGPWYGHEPSSVPADRVLARGTGSRVGTAFAKVHDRRLTIDLGNSVPETGFGLEKLDLGPLTVVAATPAGEVVLGTLPPASYDTAAYEATSGLVELALDEAQAAAAPAGDLEVRTQDGTPLLREQPLTVCADPASLYLEEGDGGAVGLRAFERGGPPSSPVSITVVDVQGPLSPVEVQTDVDGRADVPVGPSAPGSWTVILVPWRGVAPPAPTRLVPELHEYFTVRTTPADAEIAGLAPTWDNVYERVLRDWEALAPCMDNWLRLGDEEQCRAYAPLIRKLTSREHFDSYRYMPVTRDLTRGQRTLLHRWCDAVTAGPARLEAAPAETPPRRDPFGRGF